MSAAQKGPRLRKVGPARPKLSAPIAKRPRAISLFKPIARFVRPTLKVIGFIIPPYFKNSWSELRQVAWPNRSETWKLTSAVFIFAIVFGAAILGVDKVLDEVFKKVVLK